MVEQDRREFGQFGAREGPFQCTVVPVGPAAHQCGSFERVAKAHLGQAVERLAVVGLRRKQQRPSVASFARGRILEQGRIVSLHVAQVPEQHLGECVTVRKASKAGKLLEPFALRWAERGSARPPPSAAGSR